MEVYAQPQFVNINPPTGALHYQEMPWVERSTQDSVYSRNATNTVGYQLDSHTLACIACIWDS